MDLLPVEENPSDLLEIWKQYKIPVVLGVGSVVLAVISIFLLVKSSQSANPIQFSHTNSAQNTDTAGSFESSTLGSQSANLGGITVDVEGAVVKPGLVTLLSGNRVEDAIVAAGGLRRDADEIFVAQNINRAMKLVDGMKLYIPSVGEDQTSYNPKLNGSIDETSHNFSAVVAKPGASSQNGAFVSINMASKDDLDSLPGVGPVTAQKIIDNRPYASLDDLVTKKAIGPSLYAKLKNMLSL